MRVEAYNQVAQVYKANKIGSVQRTNSTSSSRDEFQMSSVGRDYQIAKQAVAEASDIREDRVAELKAKVKSDNYAVDMEDFANKLLEKYNSSIM